MTVYLDKIHDPSSHFFYLTLEESTRPIQLRKVYTRSIIVDVHDEIINAAMVKGFIVLKDGQGILQFSARIDPQELIQDKFDVIELHLVDGTEQSLNRREFVRLDLLPPERASMTDINGDKTDVSLLDLSIGGLCIKSKRPLVVDRVYQLRSSLQIAKTLLIDFAIQILFRKDFADQQSAQHVYGATFVKKSAHKNFRVMTESEKHAILQYINAVLLRRRRERD